jgi:hypothetical protein
MARGLTVQEAEHASYLFAGTPINFSGNNPAHIMMQNELVFCVFCDLMIRSIAGYSDTGRPEIISGLRKSAPKGSFLSRYFCFLEDKRRFAVYQKLEGDRDLLLKILSDGTEGEAGFLVNFGLPDFLEDFSFGIFHPDFLSNINVRTEAEFPVDMTAEGLVKLFFACDLLWGLGDKSPKDPWAIRLSIKSESVRHFRAAVDALSASELKFELRSRLLKDQDKKTFEYEKEGIRFSVSFEERSIIIEYD